MKAQLVQTQLWMTSHCKAKLGEGRFALGNIPVCAAPTSPPCRDRWGSRPKIPTQENLPKQPLGDPWIHPPSPKGAGV